MNVEKQKVASSLIDVPIFVVVDDDDDDQLDGSIEMLNRIQRMNSLTVFVVDVV